MVYILGQLFRNSITQQKETTLYEEVESSKLYMKLFQTKHPDKIAYQFSLAADVEELVLPKFIIQIIDNGKGFSPNQLAKMNDYLTGSEEGLTSVGFKNANERLRLFFGSRYQMTLTSVPNKETKIRLRIPLSDQPKEDTHV